MGDASSTGVGTGLVTYDSAVGVRLLTAAEYATAMPANGFDPARTPNVLANNATLTVPVTTAINALKLTAGGNVTGPGNLTLTGATILATGNASITVPNLNNSFAGLPDYGWNVLTAGAQDRTPGEAR